MKKLAPLFLMFALAAGLACTAHADFQVEGTLLSFDAQKIKIRQSNNKTIFISRKSMPNLEGYTLGKAKVRAMVTAREMIQLNPAIAEVLGRRPAAKK